MRLFKHLDQFSLGSGTTNQRVTVIFFCLYLGYMMVTYIRKTVSLASPVIMEAESIEKSQFGLILSSQMLGYSISKFVGGVLADLVSPSRVFAAVLLLSGSTVMAFTAFDTVPMFAFLWFMNGLSMGPCWPACALLIKRWFPAERFGTWWSVLSTSMNVSGTLGPLVSAFLLSHYTWRFSLCTIESSRAPPVSWKEGVKALLLEPVFIGTCMSYLLVSVVRGACADWGQLYLILEKGHSRLTGSGFISSQELGGIIGSLCAGYLSDYIFSKNLTSYNPRLLVILLWITTVGFWTGFVGMILSGYPLSLIAKLHNWHAVFLLVQAVSVATVAVALFCALRSAVSKTEKHHRK
ncbi:hypothetical protein BaRGS_00017995 [Batillaria attramentaria]|uniref:Major facilitator superfamily (MFS) profile domain-containing protein n=1 Tax=Batillaria attramentaria TaxID=370345 RepID=A0ABD0KU31_9CAEN